MKNRLFSILPLVLFLLSTPAFADLTFMCTAIPGAATTFINADDPANYTPGVIDLSSGTTVDFVWKENNPNFDINHVRFDERDYTQTNVTDSTGWRYIGWANHDDNNGMIDDTTFHNTYTWLVPSNYSGSTIEIRITDYAQHHDGTPPHQMNTFTIVCTVDGSAKKESYLTNPGIEVTCFPNPVINELKVFSDNSDVPIESIQLYDMTGNAIRTYFYDKTFMETIDVADLPKGTYVAIINEESQVKIVKN